MTRLNFYGGAGEIGGNKILLEDRDSRILLDFGMSLSDRGRFFAEPFLQPRDEQSLRELGIIPEIQGLYREEEDVAASGVVLSHSHIDHSMCISLLNRKIPVYCGETTRIILEALSEVRQTNFENNLEGISFKRSEEHTSELQSRGHLVCRLLLEKKKKEIPFQHLLHHMMQDS